MCWGERCNFCCSYRLHRDVFAVNIEQYIRKADDASWVIWKVQERALEIRAGFMLQGLGYEEFTALLGQSCVARTHQVSTYCSEGISP